MAGERQCNAIRHGRKNIRLVNEQQHRIVGLNFRQRARQIVDAAKSAGADPMGELVAQTGQPEFLPVCAEKNRIVLH